MWKAPARAPVAAARESDAPLIVERLPGPPAGGLPTPARVPFYLPGHFLAPGALLTRNAKTRKLLFHNFNERETFSKSLSAVILRHKFASTLSP